MDVIEVADGGNPYWEKIMDAVSRCDIFVPVITSTYLNEFKDAPILEQKLENEEAQNLSPVVREAYYAIHFGKRPCPIVILDEQKGLDAGMVERIAKDRNDSRNLPLKIFSERTILQFNDANPALFKLPEIRK